MKPQKEFGFNDFFIQQKTRSKEALPINPKIAETQIFIL
jgi:hypothetical protein